MRIGIHSPNWVGDAVMSLPFIHYVSHSFRDDEMILVAKTWVAAIFQNYPSIHRIQVMKHGDLLGPFGTTRTGLRLRKDGFGVFYLLTDSWRSAYLAWLSGSRERIGFRAQGRSSMLSVAIPHSTGIIHRSREYLRLLSGEHATEKGDYSDEGNDRTGIQISESETEWANGEMGRLGLSKPIALFPSSVAPSRRVPLDKWKQIVNVAKEDGYTLLVFGSAKDRETGEFLVNGAGGKGIRSVCGSTSLRQSICLLSLCDGAIGTDTGLGHVSANLGIKTVSLFGAGDPARTAPLGPRTTIITEKVYCSPCRKNVCPNSEEPLVCLTSMDPLKIWEAYLAL